MENASKALIIAGAILLAILLISLGIIVFTQAQDTISNSGMSQAEVQTFNNQFLKYEGSQKGTLVKSMVQEVLAVNANGSGFNVTIKKGGSDTETITDTASIINSNTYTVKLSYGTDGRVNKIDVSGTFST